MVMIMTMMMVAQNLNASLWFLLTMKRLWLFCTARGLCKFVNTIQNSLASNLICMLSNLSICLELQCCHIKGPSPIVLRMITYFLDIFPATMVSVYLILISYNRIGSRLPLVIISNNNNVIVIIFIINIITAATKQPI